MATLTCAMHAECAREVTHVDNKGYVYCTGHGSQRRTTYPCRALKSSEVTKLLNGQTIKY